MYKVVDNSILFCNQSSGVVNNLKLEKTMNNDKRRIFKVTIRRTVETSY